MRKSRFDDDVVCIEARSDSPQVILDRLDEKGLGFAVFGTGVQNPFVVVDHRAGLSADQLLAVEAHEIGHVMTGSTDEATAELYAIALLRVCGHPRAAQILLDRGIVCKEDADLV